METHRIDLRPDLRPRGCRHGKTPMLYQGKSIGSSNSPVYAAVRWLLDNNAAAPDDTVESYRGEMLCMSGRAGELAKWTVRENDHGNPSLQLVPYKAFSSDFVGSRTTKTPQVPETRPQTVSQWVGVCFDIQG
jgi:hypothetical protein